ncbi:MAG: class I SAM-dependent methyltransferase [Terriglobia bacterium]
MNRIHLWFCRSERWKRRLKAEVLPWALEGVSLEAADVLELGPGPGLTTDFLSNRVRSLTALELDSELARSLGRRIGGSGVRVVNGDATMLPFAGGRFSTVLAFTMLHHVPSPVLQDQLFSEAFRVLKPGGIFLGIDSRASLRMRVFHLWDTMVIIDPDILPRRLESSGFSDVAVSATDRRFRFTARRH